MADKYFIPNASSAKPPPRAALSRKALPRKDSAPEATTPDPTAPLVAEVRRGRIIFGVFLVHTAIAVLTLGSRFAFIGVLRPTLLLDAVLWCWWGFEGFPRGVPCGLAEPWGRRVAILFGWALLTVPFVRWPGSVLREGVPTFLVAASFLYFITIYCTTWQRLRLFVAVWMACQIFRVLQPLYLHTVSGYWGDHAYMGDGEFMHRLSGAPGDTVNPNGLGFIVASVIPFLHYLCWPQRSRLVKIAYVATAICLMYGLILTGSRSAVVAVLIDVLLIAWRSKSRFLAIAIVAIGLGVSVHYMNANFIDRYESIVSNDTQNARTREGRINGTLQDFELGLERPIVGFGLGTSEEANWHVLHSDLLAHDVYAEALIEVGIPGLLIYLSFLMSVVRCVSQTRTALARAPPDSDGYEFKQAMSSALRVWVPMALVFFLSQYGLRELDWYIAAGMAGSLFGLVRQLPVSPAPSMNEPAPTARSFRRDGAFLTHRAPSKAQ